MIPGLEKGSFDSFLNKIAADIQKSRSESLRLVEFLNYSIHGVMLIRISMRTIVTFLIVISVCFFADAQDKGLNQNESTLEMDSLSTDTFSITTIYEETTPQFPGGEVEFYKYIQNHLQYPHEAKKEGIEGIVVVSFEIDTNGAINRNSVDIVRSPNKVLNQEAIRLIRSSPPWIPATRSKNGATPLPVRRRIEHPVAFRIK